MPAVVFEGECPDGELLCRWICLECSFKYPAGSSKDVNWISPRYSIDGRDFVEEGAREHNANNHPVLVKSATKR